MKNEYDCEIISDLLPLYLDGQVSGETETVVKDHLDKCGNCMKIYNSMAQNIEIGLRKKEDGESTRPDCGVSRQTAMKPGKIRSTNILIAVILGYIFLNVATWVLILMDIIFF